MNNMHNPVIDDLAQDLKGKVPEQEADKLLAIARTISETQPPARSPEAKRAAWMQLEERMEEGEHKKWYATWRLLTVPAFMILLLLGLNWMSATALPGDFGYGVKRAGESAQLAVTLSPQKKADMCSMLMKRRANELEQLSGRQVSGSVVASLTSAIHSEADEYARYANASGDSKSRLETQRKRDAQYVIEALQQIDTSKQSAQGRQAIEQTIESMQSIVANA